MSKTNQYQASFTVGEISDLVAGRIDIDKYKSACRTAINVVALPFGPMTRRPGFKFVQELPDSSKTAKLVEFEYSNQQTYILEFSDLLIRFYKDQGIILSGGSPYSIVSPYAEADLTDLRFTQSFDTVYITHPNYAPRKLVRNGHTNWVLSTVSFSEPAWLDENTTAVTMTPSGTTGSITITASSATFASTDVGRSIRYKSGPDKSKTISYPGTGTQVYYDIPFYPQTSSDIDVNFVEATGTRTAKTYIAGAPGAGQYTIANGQVQTGDTASTSQKVEIAQKNAGSGQWGWVTITAYTNSTTVTATVQRTLAGTNASVYWRLGAWSDTTGWPKLCTFHEQRLWFANTTTQPNTIWGSRTADFENFQYDNDEYKGTAEASSSVTYSLETPAIQFIAGLRAMLCGCNNGIIPIVSQNGAIEATSTPLARIDGNYRCEDLPIVKTADEILFIELLQKRVNSAAYSYEKDGFKVDDLTLLAPQISESSGFKQLAYAETPNRVLWVILEDGSLVSCTFKANQNLTGWTRHTVGGTGVVVESIAVIPGTSYSEVWAIIKRTINGSTKRYVEVMQPFFNAMDKEDAFFVDSGLTYNGTPATTISGLDHLEGETVTILADGAALPSDTVSGGSITLPNSYSVVTVGLGYNSDIEPVYQEGGSRLGVTQMNMAKITQLGLRLYETLNLKIGSDSSNLKTVNFRTGSDLMDNTPALYTGDKLLDFDDDWELNYNVYIRQDLPYPMTIVSLLFKAEVSDQ